VKAQNYAFERRWRKLEAAKRQTRKIAYTLMAVVFTSLIVVMTASGA
jgi:hypothetical protein